MSVSWHGTTTGAASATYAHGRKGMALPLSAVITTDKIAQMAKNNRFSHYTSHASDPFTATAVLAVYIYPAFTALLIWLCVQASY